MDLFAAFALAREFVFPSDCACCGASLLDAQEASWGVCFRCADKLTPEPGPRCDRCGRPLVSEFGTCLECRELPKPSHDGAFLLFRYGGDPLRFMAGYKFGAHRSASVFAAMLIARTIQANRPAIGEGVVVPVPPRPGKLRRTGWDQVSAVARALAVREGLAVDPCLRRLPGRVQKTLDRADRARNMEGAFVCSRRPPERAVLIDDVCTTGATLNACAHSLKAAGCRYVFAIALCYD